MLFPCQGTRAAAAQGAAVLAPPSGFSLPPPPPKKMSPHRVREDEEIIKKTDRCRHLLGSGENTAQPISIISPCGLTSTKEVDPPHRATLTGAKKKRARAQTHTRTHAHIHHAQTDTRRPELHPPHPDNFVHKLESDKSNLPMRASCSK